MQEDKAFDWPSPALFQAIVMQIQEAIIVVDRHEVIQVWNNGAESIFGYTAGEMKGRTLETIIPERLQAAHSTGFSRAVETGQTKYAGRVMTTKSMHKSGAKLYVELSFVLLRDEAGAVIGVCAVARDGTAQYLARQAAGSLNQN